MIKNHILAENKQKGTLFTENKLKDNNARSLNAPNHNKNDKNGKIRSYKCTLWPKLADNYWKPKIKEAQKFGKKHIFSEFTELYLLIYGPCLKFFVQLLLYLNFSFN